MSFPELSIASHPLLHALAFITEFPGALGELVSPESLTALLAAGAEAPVRADESVRAEVRALLRHGGYKPSGRGKPASEYLVRAATDGSLGSINLAVDVLNVVSLHSGIPISVVDLDRVAAPLSIRLGAAGESYVFNSAGQVIELEGLLCLCDAAGPCANAVKDSQRTKTGPETRRTLSLLWGPLSQQAGVEAAEAWYRDLLGKVGATVTGVSRKC